MAFQPVISLYILQIIVVCWEVINCLLHLLIHWSLTYTGTNIIIKVFLSDMPIQTGVRNMIKPGCGRVKAVWL
jgi:hypothetical protein